EDGGHLTIWIDRGGFLRVRMQGTDESVELKYRDERIEAGESYNVAFTFNHNAIQLYVNGALVDEGDNVPGGMSGNTDDMLIGASSRQRRDENDNAEWLFEGEIENVTMFNRRLSDVEAVLLDEFESDASMLLMASSAMDLPQIIGNNWADIMNGTDVNELIRGMGGHDEINGWSGADIIMGGDGDDMLIGHRGNDTLHGESGDDRLFGGGHSDVIHGGSGDDRAYGGWGHDTINGDYGDDTVVGEGGNDTLNGGGGNDFIAGGDGRDTIIFDFYGEEHADRIGDFRSVDDRLAFDETVFDLGDNLREAFTVGPTAREADDRLIYHHSEGLLYYDADGSGTEFDMELVARFGRGTQVTIDDITTI
ncbi:MAG: LamG-like jellyroll fold domain-containing protein, partial [Pseudomonadota bacterium]